MIHPQNLNSRILEYINIMDLTLVKLLKRSSLYALTKCRKLKINDKINVNDRVLMNIM